MNVIDRSFTAKVAHVEAKRAALRKRRRIVHGFATLIIVIAAAAFYVWATTLCGDCSGPLILPKPPA